MRKNKILILSFSILILISCKTVYISPSLPSYEPIRPERPTLENVNEEVPLTAVKNTIRLMTYAEQLEAYADGWENFYTELITT